MGLSPTIIVIIMFDIEKDKKFYYCKYNFDKETWGIVEEFDNKEDFLKFLASHHEEFYSEYNCVNYTGNDTAVLYTSDENCFPKKSRLFRNILFCDGNDKIIDIRNLKTEVKKYLPIKRCWRNFWPGFSAPEPQGDKERITSYKLYKRKNWCFRKEKNWFHNHRLDFIPEYKEYVRHKGTVPNIWDTEPIIHHEKSWKHINKCKKQWQKNFNPHYDTYITLKEEETDKYEEM